MEGADSGLFKNSLINGSHFTKSIITKGTVNYSILKSSIRSSIDYSYVLTPDDKS